MSSYICSVTSAAGTWFNVSFTDSHKQHIIQDFHTSFHETRAHTLTVHHFSHLPRFPPQSVCDEVSITLNKNSVVGDKSAVVPGGIRIGTCALTTRGFTQEDFIKVADFIHRAVVIAKDCATKTAAPAKLKDFKEYLEVEGKSRADLKALREEVELMSESFPMPGL